MSNKRSSSVFSGLTVTELPITTLKANPHNPRTHSDKQIQQVARSIREFGFTNPVLIDENENIIAGHGRVLAAKTLGLKTVPTIRLEHMSEAQKRAYIIADNKLAENAGWDESLLAVELDYLSHLELDFDVTLTGFETAEIDILLGPHTNEPDPADNIPEINRDTPPITQPGDLWLLGNHRLLCADATQKASYTRLMEGERARLVFTDPPYNVPIDGHVCGSGKIKHREFQMASGEMSEAEFKTFLTKTFVELAEHSANGSIHYICMDWRHMGEVLAAGNDAYTELKNLCVWNKSNAGMGTFYRSKHELVFVFKSGKRSHINNIELGKFGRYRTNIWDYEGVNTFHPSRRKELSLHPTVKPIAMVADAILDSSKHGQIVLDPFAGSGTTILAAEKTNRRCFCMELDPYYVDICLMRFEEIFGLTAIHAETGNSFKTGHAVPPEHQEANGRTSSEVPHA